MAPSAHSNDNILSDGFFSTVCKGLKQAPKAQSVLASYFAAVHEFSEPFVEWTPSRSPSPPSSPNTRKALIQYTPHTSSSQEEGNEVKSVPRKRKRDVSPDPRPVKRSLLQEPRPPCTNATANSNSRMQESGQDEHDGTKTVTSAREKDNNEKEDACHIKFACSTLHSSTSQDGIAHSSAPIDLDMSTVKALQNALHAEHTRREWLEKRYTQLSKDYAQLKASTKPLEPLKKVTFSIASDSSTSKASSSAPAYNLRRRRDEEDEDSADYHAIQGVKHKARRHRPDRLRSVTSPKKKRCTEDGNSGLRRSDRLKRRQSTEDQYSTDYNDLRRSNRVISMTKPVDAAKNSSGGLKTRSSKYK
jgi:hypothetical protein